MIRGPGQKNRRLADASQACSEGTGRKETYDLAHFGGLCATVCRAMQAARGNWRSGWAKLEKSSWVEILAGEEIVDFWGARNEKKRKSFTACCCQVGIRHRQSKPERAGLAGSWSLRSRLFTLFLICPRRDWAARRASPSRAGRGKSRVGKVVNQSTGACT